VGVIPIKAKLNNRLPVIAVIAAKKAQKEEKPKKAASRLRALLDK